MTRATESLFLSSSARPSRFIANIEPSYLRTNSRMKIRRFYNVPIDAFRYPERLANIHSAEEKVRQWVMAELVATYGYPTDCLAVEYPVKVFSKTGYVDVAVLINRDGQVTPFIFIETKRRGRSMDDGIKQVQSYMHHCHTCCFGAVTDGAVFRVIEREAGQVKDLPVFRSSWGLSNTVRHAYRDLKTGRDATFCFDPNDPTSMELDCQGDCDLLDETKLAKIPVYGSIAAGQPLNMNTELDENVYLPRAWVRGADHFALKVKGDSMTGASIDDGDIVVARVQSGADNLDIVVVALGDAGTLKRFSKMGNNAILLAENPKYDPILLNDDQVNILGLAVGVIKSGNPN
jgi:SOS regulatory protein LexA